MAACVVARGATRELPPLHRGGGAVRVGRREGGMNAVNAGAPAAI
jgi:hypothetical protein